MKVWKLNKGRKGGEKERSFRSCTQALSADVCQSVPYEAPLWAELLLVHYGWGAILRHWGCCILIFEGREDDSLLPNPFMRFIQYLMGSDKQVQNVFQHTKRREEVNRLECYWSERECHHAVLHTDSVLLAVASCAHVPYIISGEAVHWEVNKQCIEKLVQSGSNVITKKKLKKKKKRRGISEVYCDTHNVNHSCACSYSLFFVTSSTSLSNEHLKEPYSK